MNTFTKRVVVVGLVWALLAVVLSFSNVSAQLLYRPGEGYENYAREGYRRYGKAIFYQVLNPVYDELGDFVMNGVEIYSLRETQTQYPYPGSVIRKNEYYYDYANNLAVVYDSYGGWSTRITVGDNIRTKFTPLSLDIAALNGIRWDADLGANKVTMVTSRVDRPIFNLDDSLVHNMQIHMPRYATYLLGGHWETQVGILNIGGTYVNQYRMDSLVDVEQNSLKGVLPERNAPVSYLVVKIADGSDISDGGARVYDVRMFIDGKVNSQPPAITRHDAAIIDLGYPNGDRGFPRNRTIPPFVEFLKGQLPSALPVGNGYAEAEGTHYLLYWFKMPAGLGAPARSVEFEALVAGDYLISMSEVYLYEPTAPESDPLRRYSATYFFDVAGAEGSPQNLSNLKVVRFRYGRQTSDMIAGVQIGASTKGFDLKAEYKRSFDFRQYPSRSGDRFPRTADAFYVNLTRDFNKWFSVGGEYFTIPAHYSTCISVQDPSYAKSYMMSIDSPFSEASMFLKNDTLELGTVDDNDDKDRFPDSYFLLERADNNGVFPGQDRDLDGRPDTNENNNDIPDHLEPFLLYDVNPQEYDYGDDLNNNGFIDEREDDDKPDYPYDADLRGHHVFCRVGLSQPLRLTLGHLDTRQVLAGGQNVATYGRIEYSKYVPLLAEVYFVSLGKKVRDDIRNDVFQFQQGVLSSFNPDPVSRFGVTYVSTALVEDRLLMRNSFVNTSYLRLGFKGIGGFNFEHSLKHELNHQIISASHDKTNDIHRWAYVGKADYTYRLGKLTLRPQLKIMAYKVQDDQKVVLPVHERYIYPILRADYALTPRTTIKAGAQGLPFLNSSYENIRDWRQSYSSQDYLIMLTNRSIYRGYEVSFNVGYELKAQSFRDTTRSSEDVDYSLFFIRLMVGAESI